MPNDISTLWKHKNRFIIRTVKGGNIDELMFFYEQRDYLINLKCVHIISYEILTKVIEFKPIYNNDSVSLRNVR